MEKKDWAPYNYVYYQLIASAWYKLPSQLHWSSEAFYGRVARQSAVLLS